jgi:hypothetical protein
VRTGDGRPETEDGSQKTEDRKEERRFCENNSGLRSSDSGHS